MRKVARLPVTSLRALSSSAGTATPVTTARSPGFAEPTKPPSRRACTCAGSCPGSSSSGGSWRAASCQSAYADRSASSSNRRFPQPGQRAGGSAPSASSPHSAHLQAPRTRRCRFGVIFATTPRTATSLPTCAAPSSRTPSGRGWPTTPTEKPDSSSCGFSTRRSSATAPLSASSASLGLSMSKAASSPSASIRSPRSTSILPLAERASLRYL
jgi:hypothetical protein